MIVEIFEKAFGEAVALSTLAFIFTVFLNFKHRSPQLEIIEIINFLLSVSINGFPNIFYKFLCNLFLFFFTREHFGLCSNTKVDG